MNTSSSVPFLSVVFGPFAAALVAIIFANIGIAAKAKRISYLLTRVELVKKILETVTATDTHSEELLAACRRDLLDVMVGLRATAIRTEELAKLEFDQRPWYRRLFPPRSGTISGVMAIVVYYVYLAQTTAWVVATTILFWYPFDNLSPIQGIFMIINQSLGAVLGYWWAVRSARTAAIITHARGLVALYGLTDPLSAKLIEEEL